MVRAKLKITGTVDENATMTW